MFSDEAVVDSLLISSVVEEATDVLSAGASGVVDVSDSLVLSDVDDSDVGSELLSVDVFSVVDSSGLLSVLDGVDALEISELASVDSEVVDGSSVDAAGDS